MSRRGKPDRQALPTRTVGVPSDIPALFATIHFRSGERPDGYTDEEISRLNEELNKPTD